MNNEEKSCYILQMGSFSRKTTLTDYINGLH